jgi:hypothetical protein
MTYRASNRLDDLEKDCRYAPQCFALWVDADDTPADIEAKRARAIAEGLANADDQFVLIRWKRKDEA